MFNHKQILLTLLAALFLLKFQPAFCKFVSVRLDSKWPSSPLLLELSEFLAKDSIDAFWKFVDIVALQPLRDNVSEAEIYSKFVPLAAQNVPGQTARLMELALSLRAYSPGVAMQLSFADEHIAEALGRPQLESRIETMTPDEIWRKGRPVAPCDNFVFLHGELLCDPTHLDSALERLRKDKTELSPVMLFKSERIYSRQAASAESWSAGAHLPIAILYGELGTAAHAVWHTKLKQLALSSSLTYVHRHYFSEKSAPRARTRLTGYGVELAIKSTEYKARDDTLVTAAAGARPQQQRPEDNLRGFNFTRLSENHPGLSNELDEFKQHVEEGAKEMPVLKVWQLQDLDFQASQKIVSVNGFEGLKLLRDLSQNYPLRSKEILNWKVSAEFRSEVQANQRVLSQSQSIAPGESALIVNGIETPDLAYYDTFALLDSLHAETHTVEALHALGFRAQALLDTMRINLKVNRHEQYALDFRDKSILWLNDLEKDSAYRGWPSSLYAFLQPSFSLLRQVRRNVANLVIFVDPIDERVGPLLRITEALFLHQLPVRIGLVFIPGESPLSLTFARMLYYIASEESIPKALSFATDIYGDVTNETKITEEMLEKHFSVEYSKQELNEVQQWDETFMSKLAEVRDYVSRTGFRSFPQVLINGVPIAAKDLIEDEFENAIFTTLFPQLSKFQGAVYNGEITDANDVTEWLMSQPNVVPRMNRRVLIGDESVDEEADDASAISAPGAYLRFAPASTIDEAVADDQVLFAETDPAKLATTIAARTKYLTKKDENDVFEITEWVVGDFDTKEGQELLLNALKHLKTSGAVRIAFIHNPSALLEAAPEAARVPPSLLIAAALRTLSNTAAKNLVGKLLRHLASASASAPVGSAWRTTLDASELSSEPLQVHGVDVKLLLAEALHERTRLLIRAHARFCRHALRLAPAQRTVVSNGRVLGAFHHDETFTPDDFKLLDKLTAGTAPITRLRRIITNNLASESYEISNLIMKTASVLLSNPSTSTRRIALNNYGLLSKHSILRVPPDDPTKPAFDIEAIIDPLSKTSQKLSQVLLVLHRALNANITIYMNPREKLSEAPLKTFYRFVLEPQLEFEADGSRIQPVALFASVPEKSLFTLGMDAPHSWMVESVDTPYDLDNIFLHEVPGNGIDAGFELEYQLLEGHCTEVRTGQPPRGLQFTLGTRSDPVMYDTIVMANLGYFQLKAFPGAWVLRVREGRSAELFEIAGTSRTDTPRVSGASSTASSSSSDVIALISSFKSKIIRVKVAKRPGKEKEDLLSDGKLDDAQNEEAGGGGIWSTITSFGSSGSSTKKESSTSGNAAGEKDDTLNIFSLASGHLYERLLRIMMLSVLKHTKAKVKFWFLKNYLSPSFKKFLPQMARRYGFEIELVQYSWPRWLFAQTEKQRIIWAYKILFFDVLFPLNLTKIIYVDADQVVRADLTELRDLDLEGNPYGYTPFCESRKEMEGYRFWKTGYWSNHLGARKYHISALYVVDLVRFRRIAAGDRLRGQYQALAPDPNSLSNLDQDLPNNMIHQVGIKSLPPHWLWCETWCSDDEKAAAKTIDLCNNPMTKEPKLKAAQRIIVEWKDYDAEQRRLWDEYFATSSAPTITEDTAAAASSISPTSPSLSTRQQKAEL